MTTITDRVTLARYQELALATDQNRRDGLAGVKFPMLGLFGEVGSLLAELKKKQRDGLVYADFREALLEEFGDVLWYFSNVASRVGLKLEDLEKVSKVLVVPETNKGNGYGRDSDVQAFEDRLIKLAGEVGIMLHELSDEDGTRYRGTLIKSLPIIFQSLVEAARSARIDIREAGELNVLKIRNRWPEPNATPTSLFDAAFDEDEQLPRDIKMLFQEKKVGDKTYVLQKCNGIKIGDRLTDNMSEDDGYRYHDVFHLGFAAVLGWSPVIRALFKCKRKSNAAIDEVQDGARAIVIEEGVSTWIFNYAAGHGFFEGVTTLDYDLLKRIKVLVKGFEVEQCPLWEWEKTILSGYETFRRIRRNHGGMVHADLVARTINCE